MSVISTSLSIPTGLACRRIRSFAVTAASLSLAVFVRAQAPVPSERSDAVVVTINGEPVTAGEYSLVMGRQAPRVYASLKAEKNLDDHFGYWNPDAGPGSPFVKLREMVLQELVTIKIQQTMAKEKGLQNDISFAGFQDGFLKENDRRKQALAAGTVIYGPKQHNETAYYYILFGDLSHRLKRKVCEETSPRIPDEEIRKFYEEHKAALKNPAYETVKDRIAGEIAERNFEQFLPSFYKSAKVEINEDIIRTLLPRHDVAPANPAQP